MDRLWKLLSSIRDAIVFFLLYLFKYNGLSVVINQARSRIISVLKTFIPPETDTRYRLFVDGDVVRNEVDVGVLFPLKLSPEYSIEVVVLGELSYPMTVKSHTLGLPVFAKNKTVVRVLDNCTQDIVHTEVAEAGDFINYSFVRGFMN
jgi:hypothetical protein